jgi:hypothetical protein
MKKLLALSMMTVLLGMMIGPAVVLAGEKGMGAPIAHSGEFETMKKLIGTWEGKAGMGKGMEPVKVTYELTSAGNAILERLFPGTPHDMVTVYYDFDGKLNMVHYCSLGNQPHMELVNSAGGSLEFVLPEKNPGLSLLKEMHMHSLRITIDGEDSITHNWTLYDNGEKKSVEVIKLVRSKN